MRIIRFIAEDGRTLTGEDAGDGRARVLTGSIMDHPKRSGEIARVVKPLAPIVPANIICIGRNYGDAAKLARKGDESLEVFLKPATAIAAPNDAIGMPRFDGLDAQLDCEGELAVVIAREASHVGEAQALDHVLGYTLANDVTARAFQTASGPPLWMRGKGFDGFCPLGPVIITRDEIADPQNLTLRIIIDGVVTREASTGEMVWSVAEIIACLSRHITLPPGTVILTGAPVAKATPPLKAASVCVVEIESVGRLSNTIAGR